MKKANAILEYGILLFIVVGFLAGIHYYLKRNIQARIKHEVDTQLRRPMPFLWQSSVGFMKVETTWDKTEEVGGDITIDTNTKIRSTTLSAPPPPVMITSGLHSQDAARPAPMQSNPKHNQTDDERKIQPAKAY